MTDQWNTIYSKEGKNYTYYNILEPHQDMEKIGRFFHKNRVRKILDLGCGAGRNLLYLARGGFDITGLDIAPDGLKILREELAKQRLSANLSIGNIYDRLPYENNAFDALISVQVLQHGTQTQILRAISEVKRILRPGGYIFITLCGRLSKGKIRECLVRTATKIAPNTYVPTKGNEAGLTHFIYNKSLIKKHFHDFKIIEMWKDDKDYYCFLARLSSPKQK